jgi:hypothetical protein
VLIFALAVAAAWLCGASNCDAAKLKWRPFRPANAEETALKTAAGAKEKFAEEILRTAAQSDDPLADPFEDDAKGPKSAPDSFGEPASPNKSRDSDDLDLDSLDEPQKPAPREEEPNPLQPTEDYFPEEQIPQKGEKNSDDTMVLPEEEPVPSQPFNDEDLTIPEYTRPARPGDCSSEKADCKDALAKIKSNTLNNIDLNIRVTGTEGQDFPCTCPFGAGETFEGRNWSCVTYEWKASGLCHKPLYFEQVAVERYGHSATPILQDVMCGVHFFASVVTLPYMMGMCPPDECQYSLGYYRPGNCAPYLLDPIPLSLRGGLFQAGAIVGGILIIP